MADSNPNPTEQNKIYQYLGQKLKIDTLVVKNSIISVLTIGFDFIYSFIFSILIIRNYSKSVYGSFEYIFGFFVLAQILTIPGLRVILFKSASQNLDGLYRRIYKFTLRISFLSLIFMGIAAIIYFFQQGSRNNDVVVGLLIAGFCCSSYYGLLIWGDFLKAKENFALFFKYELIIVLSRLGLLLYIYASGIESALMLVGLNIVVNSIGNIVLTRYCYRFVKNDEYPADWVKQGFILSLLNVSSMVFGSVDKIIVGSMLSLEELASYALIFSITDILLVGVKKIFAAISPRIYRYEITRYFRISFLVFALSFLAPLILGVFIQYPVIWIYSERYADIVPYLRLALFAIPFRLYDEFLGAYLIKYDLNVQLNISKILSIVIILSLYFLFITNYGLLGAVICLVLNSSIQTIFLLYFGLKHNYQKNRIATTIPG